MPNSSVVNGPLAGSTWGARGTLSSECSAGIIPLLKAFRVPVSLKQRWAILSLAVRGREMLHRRKLVWLRRKVLVQKLSFALDLMGLEGNVISWMDVSSTESRG